MILTVATSKSEPVEQAIGALRESGRVVVVGVSDIHPSRQEMWEREAEIVVSRAGGPGSLDPDFEERGKTYPYAEVRWTQQRNLEEFLRLVGLGQVRLEPLITHRCRLEDAPSIYAKMVDPGGELFVAPIITYGEAAPSSRVKSMAVASSGRTRTDTRQTGTGELNLAVCGAGTFARSLLIPAIRRIAGMRLRTLVTERGGESSHIARKANFELHSTDYDSVLLDPALDAVVIATPHRLHARMVKDALLAGKHVFVEKPLCISGAELDEIQEVYDALGAARPALMVGYNRRFSRHAEWARAAIDAHTTPVVAHYRATPGYLPPSHWVNQPEEGGGRMLGEACHFVDMLIFMVASSPTSVYAHRVDDNAAAVVANDNFTATFKFENGSIGSLTYAAVGDRGHSRERLEAHMGGTTVTIADYRRSTATGNGRRRRLTTRGQDMGYERELRYFRELVRAPADSDVRDAEPWFRSTRAALRLVDSVRVGTPLEI